ncbi:MAG: ATP synthase F1 subunit delta [Rhodothermales bacterium]
MSNLIVAKRYAQALYQEAEKDGVVAAVDADVALIHDSMNGSPELVRFFESPVISREKKGTVVDALFGERLKPLTLRFLKLLIEKRREDAFPAVVRAYQALRDQQEGIVEVKARSAKPLSEQDEADLKAALATLTGQTVRLNTTIDTGLIGGVVVRVGDTVYDGSVRHQLEALRDSLGQKAAVSLN